MIEPIEGERHCPRCQQCKPVSAFTTDNRWCKACRAESARMRKIRNPSKSRLRAARPWSAAEDAVLFDNYPTGGIRACMPHLDRTQTQAKSRVERLGLCRETPSRECWEPAWAIPTHDYCEADLALRQWGAPGMGTSAPDLGMQVGVLSPSLGLVLGVAA